MTTECVHRDAVALSNEREAAETAAVVDATADVDDAADEAAERRLRLSAHPAASTNGRDHQHDNDLHAAVQQLRAGVSDAAAAHVLRPAAVGGVPHPDLLHVIIRDDAGLYGSRGRPPYRNQ
ncbi:hypothetical protein PMKS-001518 [Pichia membranifaciens]|uniref:Uncharacterized protein n=1 Tax=Pichia membranifaciens TaxID=4926 RepID=A0A1Q2YES0_9ASCO|nr:hypothetical protein PMKS-001518 [Pichia membranifaciens]